MHKLSASRLSGVLHIRLFASGCCLSSKHDGIAAPALLVPRANKYAFAMYECFIPVLVTRNSTDFFCGSVVLIETPVLESRLKYSTTLDAPRVRVATSATRAVMPATGN